MIEIELHFGYILIGIELNFDDKKIGGGGGRDVVMFWCG